MFDVRLEQCAPSLGCESVSRGLSNFGLGLVMTAAPFLAVLRAVGALTFALLACPSVRAAEPSQAPILRIEAATHLAKILGVDADSAGRFAVTASEDKTARVWDVRGRRLLTVLRVPSDSGPGGRIGAVAIAPNGDTVAVAADVPFGSAATGSNLVSVVYLFDRTSGRVIRRLKDLPDRVFSLAFGPDGRWLATSLNGSHGIRIWDLNNPENTPKVWASTGMNRTAGISWSFDGRLVTASVDGQIRLYRINSDQIVQVAKRQFTGGEAPMSAAFSPNGREIAIGFWGSTNIDILRASDLNTVYTAAWSENKTGKRSIGGLSTVAWNPAGTTLLAAGSSWENSTVLRWGNVGRGVAVESSVPGSFLRLKVLPDGAIIVSADESLGMLASGGSWQPFQERSVADFGRADGYEFGLNDRSTAVQFTYKPEGPKVSFSLSRRSIISETLNGFFGPRNKGIELISSPRPVRVGGRPVEMSSAEFPRSFSFSHDETGFALGSNGWLRYLDSAGKLLWKKQIAGTAWGVNIPPKGKVVVAAYGDGTIRWHRLSDGAELLAFFPHADRKRWVLWTPSGYYDASPGAEDLIGWQVNRGVDQAADFFPASQFRERFYRPDVIDRILDTLDEGVAVAQANTAAGRREPTVSVAQVLPPVVEAVSAPERFSDTALSVRIRVRVPADAPSIRLRVLVNGEIMPSAKAARAVSADGTEDLTLLLPPMDSKVLIYADNRHGTSQPLKLALQWVGNRKVFAAGEQGDVKAAKPKLWVLAVGVSAYRDASVPSLSYAHVDAEVFAKTLETQRGKAYREVQARVLTQAAATRASVLAGLDWLKANVAAGDVGVVFLSGHGFTMATDRRYYYGASDVDLQRLVDTGVPYKAIQDALVEFNIRGGGTRAVFFIDTCHAGDATGARVIGVVKASNGDTMADELTREENQVLVFASSKGDQVSWEDPKLGHGAFTKALIEGLGQEWRADPFAIGQVTYKGLDAWISVRVPVLTQNRQTPRLMAPPGGVDDFPLATK